VRPPEPLPRRSRLLACPVSPRSSRGLSSQDTPPRDQRRAQEQRGTEGEVGRPARVRQWLAGVGVGHDSVGIVHGRLGRVLPVVRATATVVGIVLASDPIIVRVEVVGVTGVTNEYTLRFLLGVEVAAVVAVLCRRRARKQERIDNLTSGNDKQRGDSVHGSSWPSTRQVTY
jgi:hypothetical protein